MSAMNASFRWTEKYSVKIAALDNQHKRLFAIINELNQALANGEGKAATDSVLRKLVDYAKAHFAAEESLLANINSPKPPATGRSTISSPSRWQSFGRTTAPASREFLSHSCCSCRSG